MRHEQWRAHLLAVALAVVVCWLGTSCAPPELLEANNDVGLNETDGDADQPVEFPEVAAVIRQSCADGRSCHGAAGITNFNVEGDTQATDEQVRAAIEDVDATSGLALVEPADAEASAIYIRVTADGPQMMPPVGGRLDQDTIDMVGRWIEEGANYE